MSLDLLRSRTGNNPALILQNKHAIDQMANQLNDMYNYMKQENNAAVKKQQELASEAEAAAAEEAARKGFLPRSLAPRHLLKLTSTIPVYFSCSIQSLFINRNYFKKVI